MRKDKIQAVKLRKRGFSYNEISNKLGISKSTLNYWLSDLEISIKAKKRILSRVYKGSIEGLIKRNKNQTALAKKRAEEIRSSAREEVSSLIENRLFLSGVSLYWAEGYKKGAYGSKWKGVDFTNSDPELIKIMMRFFRNICKVSENKLKAQLVAHKNVDIEQALRFWSHLMKIPREQFVKSYAYQNRSSQGKRKNSLTHGTVHIRINDVKLFFRIIGWIEGLKSKI